MGANKATNLIDILPAEAAVRAAANLNHQPAIDITPSTTVTSLQAGVSPDCSYRLVQAAIDAAQTNISFYIYNISAPYLLDLLRNAKARGVQIRVMYDANNAAKEEKQALTDLGVEVKPAPSTDGRKVFSVCHQKFAVVDNTTLVLGSANWVDSGIPKIAVPGKYKKANREWIVRIDDRHLATWFQSLFDADWDIPVFARAAAWVEEVPPGPALFPALLPAPPAQIFDVQPFNLAQPVKVTPILSPNNYYRTVRRMILDAQTSIDIEQQYIIRGGSKIYGLLCALRKRKADGIQIRIIVSPTFTEKWEKSVKSVTYYGLVDCLRAMNLDFFTHLHNKGILVDRSKVLITSTNWSNSSIAKAREAGVLIESPDVAEYYAQVFDMDWSIAWPAVDAPANISQMFAGSMGGPREFVEIHPADMD